MYVGIGSQFGWMPKLFVWLPMARSYTQSWFWLFDLCMLLCCVVLLMNRCWRWVEIMDLNCERCQSNIPCVDLIDLILSVILDLFAFCWDFFYFCWLLLCDSLRIIQRFEHDRRSIVRSIAFTLDGHYILVGTSQGHVLIYRLLPHQGIDYWWLLFNCC